MACCSEPSRRGLASSSWGHLLVTFLPARGLGLLAYLHLKVLARLQTEVLRLQETLQLLGSMLVRRVVEEVMGHPLDDVVRHGLGMVLAPLERKFGEPIRAMDIE